jgi:hypothetical protein
MGVRDVLIEDSSRVEAREVETDMSSIVEASTDPSLLEAGDCLGQFDKGRVELCTPQLAKEEKDEWPL